MRASNDENTVYVSGTLCDDISLDHELYGEEFYTSTLMVPRLSGTIDYVPLTLPGRLMEYLPDCGRVAVTGQLRSYNRYSPSGRHLAITVFARCVSMMEDEEMPQNLVLLTGCLCKPAVFRTTPFMREIGDMLIASNRSFNKSDYLPCIAWGRNARLVSGMAVGSRLKIEGRIQSRRYQKAFPDGTVQDRTAYEVSCSSIETI